jgi:hypothetical protein
MKTYLTIFIFLLNLTIEAQLDRVWVARFDGTGNGNGDLATDVVADKYGNVYVTGCIFNESSQQEIVTIKYNSAGDTL